MSFSESGGMITVSGTNASLSGLDTSVPSYVTKTTIGGKDWYVVSTVNMQMASGATLVIDPDIEALVFDSSCAQPHFNIGHATTSPTLTIGRKRTVGGIVRYSQGIALVFDAATPQQYGPNVNGGLYASAKSKLYGYGGTIISNTVMGIGGYVGYYNTDTTAIESLEIRSSSNSWNRIYFCLDSSGTHNVAGFTIDGQDWLTDPRWTVLFPNDGPTTFGMNQRYGLISIQGGAGTEQNLYFEDMVFANNSYGSDISINNTWTVDEISILQNNDVGSALSGIFLNGTARGVFEVRHDLNCLVKDSAGSEITGAGIYIKDWDDGNRTDGISGGEDYTSDRVYTATITSGRATIDFLNFVIKNGNTGGPSSYVDALSWRNFSGDTDDEVKLMFHAWGYKPSTTIVIAKGNGGTDVDGTCLANNAITQTTKATVEAYTGLATTGPVLTMSSTHTIQQCMDWQWSEEEDNPAYMWSNSESSYVDASANTAYTFDSGFTLKLQAALTGTATLSAGTVAIDSGGSFADTITLADLTLDILSGSSHDFRSSSFSGTIDIKNSTGGALAVKVPIGTSYTRSGSPLATVSESADVDINATAILDGSIIRAYNITDDTELDLTVGLSTGTGYSLNLEVGDTASGYDNEIGDTIKLYIAKSSGSTHYKFLTLTGVLTAGDLTFVDEQELWAHANSMTAETTLQDGSLETEFTLDGTNVQVDINSPDNDFEVGAALSWLIWKIANDATGTGIRNFFGAISSISKLRWYTDATMDMVFDNTSADNVRQSDGVVLTKADDSLPVAGSMTSGYYISMISAGEAVSQGIILSALEAYGYTSTRAAYLDDINGIDAAVAAVPTAAENATAVRTELTMELGYIDDNISDIPTAAENAAAVRSELTTELAHLNADVSDAATPAEVTTALTNQGLTSARAAYLDNISAAPPTAATIATQVLTDAQSDPIHANVKEVNDLEVSGAGTEADPWGPA